MNNMLLPIHTNCFLPLVYAAFPHKIQDVRFMVNNCAPTFTKYCQFGIHYSYYYYHHTTTRRRRSYCRSGMRDTVVSDWELQEGRIAVSIFLQQMGVSAEESKSIASNSPAYLNMLVESVRDLEHFSSSMLDANANADGAFNLNFNYRDKILHIAALKGDNGKLAYLESLGFTLSSSMNVAR
ncbi:hypothetical protein MtrunA17_Chr6g0448831 [Medicago truncatula]|nr:hypothetical protein MtrunA17_Chr6g0448831 [Medicago truncatula]